MNFLSIGLASGAFAILAGAATSSIAGVIRMTLLCASGSSAPSEIATSVITVRKVIIIAFIYVPPRGAFGAICLFDIRFLGEAWAMSCRLRGAAKSHNRETVIGGNTWW